MPHTRYLVGAIALALCTAASGVAASDFSKVVVFGDSLSDSGNLSLALNPAVQPPLKFTTNPGTVTIQSLAAGLGLPLAPSLAGGTDYAWGGAGVLNNAPGIPSLVPTVTRQVDTYLGGNPVDGHALYSIWGGANDIFYHATAAGAQAVAQQLIAANTAGLPPAIAQAVAAQINAQVAAGAGVAALETAAQAQANVAAAAQQEVKLIGQLQAAGVKNLLVFNLPNIGLTPDATEQGASAAASLTGLSQIYNGLLNSGLGQLGKGIIPIDTYSLLSEVIAHPQAYGFSNVSAPACGVGSSSVQCGPAGSGLPFTYAAGTNQSYLFADGVHPTTAGHAVLGQYVASVISAPGYASLLGEAPLASTTAQTRAIRNQMVADGFGSDTRMFVNVDYGNQRFDGSDSSPRTRSNNVNLTLGGDVRANEQLSFGVALGVGQNTADFSGGGGYKMQDISGLGYINYQAGNGAYVGGYGNFGQSDFSDIERVIHLGSNRRTESGKADGSHLGGGVTGGWWFGSATLKTGPFVNVEYQDIRVNGYSENGGDSTAMWFGRQQREALISTAGWRLQGQWQAGDTLLTPYAELAWNHDSRADARAVTAGLNSMNGQFALTGFQPDASWGTADVGLAAQFSRKLSGWIGYSGRFSDDSQKYNSLNLGLKYAF
jgi:outer membrane lipase/esterase